MESGRAEPDSAELKRPENETPVSATYKALPDEDTAWQAKTCENSIMAKQKVEAEGDDGAQERMLKDEAKITPTKDATEVKFISENGDAKIDIETVKQTLSGMGKEELMKFANDPFWVRMRWLLFITFWLIWVGMLAGAIAIIVMAPKCTAPLPKEWWEESPIIQLDPSDTPTNNLKGLESFLHPLKEQSVRAISLKSIVKESLPGHVIDFKDIKTNVGSISDLEAFIKAANERDQRVVLELDPNHSSVEHPWFKRSIKKEDPYTSYYVWADGKTGPDGKRNPPNNWLSVTGGSAWEWNNVREQYYLHQFNKSQPDLNFNNTAVISEFGDILTHWLKLGISGFRLANTQYLTEDTFNRNEASSLRATDTDDYQSLVHVYTRDRPENGAVLTQWRNVVYNETNGKGLFSLQDDTPTDILQVYNERSALINLPQHSQFFIDANASIKASALRDGISRCISVSSWPGWDLNGKERPLRKRVPTDIADSLILMTLLLPGTPILRFNDSISAKDAFATLSKARGGLTFLHGDTKLEVINGSVFVYTRLKSGNPGYLVAYQSGEEAATIDVSSLPHISEEMNVLAHSPNYVQDSDLIRTKLPSNKVPMSPKSTLVLTFVPKG